MLNENNDLLKLKLKKKKLFILKFLKGISESFYLLFDSLLENPIENIWYEIFSILLGYCQLFLYIIDQTVSIIYKLDLIYE